MMDSLALERRIVVIAVDDSDHSEFAFNCKYIQTYFF